MRRILSHVVALLAASLLLWLVATYPYSVGLSRVTACALALCIAAIGVSAVTRGRLVVIGVLVGVIVLAALPRRVDVDGLRSDYVDALVAYKGKRYVWGGEVEAGIDCSGLVRAGLRDALFRRGDMRRAFSLWFFDNSARSLGEGAGGATRELFTATRLRDVETTTLLPGDLAITRDGAHILAYVGDGKYIQADPLAGTVIVVDRSDKNPWLNNAVKIVRWRVLEVADAVTLAP